MGPWARRLLDVRLREPGSLDQAVLTLRRLAMTLDNTVVPGAAVIQTIVAWVSWWNDADGQLRHLFPDYELADDLYRAQLQIQRLNEVARPWDLITHLNRVWKGRLEEEAAALERLRLFASQPGFIIVPDTSALVEGGALADINWHELVGIAVDETARLVVPILVVEELDELKRQRDVARMSRARQALRSLWELPGDRAGVMQVGPRVTLEVLLDDPWHTRMPVADVEIVDRASYLHEITGRDVGFVAADLAILFRARELGLRTCLIERPGDGRASNPPPAPVTPAGSGSP